MKSGTKSIITFAIGLSIGVGAGFTAANMSGRGAAFREEAKTSAAISPTPPLPPEHPAVMGGASASDMSPAILEAINKARSSPSDFEAQMTAGDLYYQVFRFEQAVAFYENANRLRPDDLESMVKLGNSLFNAERYVEAAAWYEKSLMRKPDDPNVRSDLGLTYYLREPQEIDRAIVEFKKSLQMDPKHEMTLQNLTIAYNTKGDEASMRETLERLKKVNPKNPAVERFGK